MSLSASVVDALVNSFTAILALLPRKEKALQRDVIEIIGKNARERLRLSIVDFHPSHSRTAEFL